MTGEVADAGFATFGWRADAGGVFASIPAYVNVEQLAAVELEQFAYQRSTTDVAPTIDNGQTNQEIATNRQDDDFVPQGWQSGELQPVPAARFAWIITRSRQGAGATWTTWGTPTMIGETATQYTQNCYWVGGPGGVVQTLPTQTDAQKINADYLPSFDSRVCTATPGTPTATLQAAWLVQRIYSSNATLATDWQPVRVVREYEASLLTFAPGDTEISVESGGGIVNPTSPQLPLTVGTQTNITYSTEDLPVWLAVNLVSGRVTKVAAESIPELSYGLVTFIWIATHTDGRTARSTILVEVVGAVAVELEQFAYQRSVTDAAPAVQNGPDINANRQDDDFVPQGWQNGELQPVPAARFVWIITRSRQGAGATWTTWGTPTMIGETATQYTQNCYWLGGPGGVVQTLPTQTDAQKINADYLPSFDSRVTSVRPRLGRPPPRWSPLWLVQRIYSSNATLATDWRPVRVVRDYVAPVPILPVFADPFAFTAQFEIGDSTIAYTLPAATISDGSTLQLLFWH